MKKALVVVDMQKDFVCKDGKLAVPGAETIIPEIQELIEEAQRNNVKIIFTTDWHTEDDPEFKVWPVHCVQNTDGAEIMPEILAGVDNPVIVRKNTLSAWTNPETKELLKDIESVYIAGVATEYCVMQFAIGSIENKLKTFVIMDAIKGVDAIPNVPKTKGAVTHAAMTLGILKAIPVWSTEVISAWRTDK